MIAADGWNYRNDPPEDGDGRKLVTLTRDGMKWVGIRHWQSALRRWVNNGEPILGERVLAWRDLPAAAEGFWNRGQFFLLLDPYSVAYREYDSWDRGSDGPSNQSTKEKT